MPTSGARRTGRLPRKRYQRHESSGTEAGNSTLLCWGRDLHNSFTAQLIHLSLLPPSAGNNPSLPCLQSSSREANITHCSMATMLQLRAKSISNLRAQQPQLPSQPGPSSIREAKDHPSQNKETELFLHRHFGLGATQRKHLPSHPQSSRFWNKPEYHGHCVSSRRGQDAQTAALPEFWW